MKQLPEQNDDIDVKKLLEKLKDNQSSLHISRVPAQTKKKFISLADSEFEGDYGMTLKWLIDMMTVSNKMELLELRFAHINSRLDAIEKTDKGEKKNE